MGAGMQHVLGSRSHVGAVGAASGASVRRTRERGAVLLLALILTTTFALMAWSLLASSDFAARARIGGAVQEQAERAAASGVEWAASLALDGSLADGRSALTLADGSEVAVVVATASSPQVIARARCRGAEVALGADLRTLAGAPLPHAFVAYGSDNKFSQNFAVSGSAWIGGVPPFFANMTGVLGMDGDLQLVTTTAIDAAAVKHTSGRTLYGQQAFALPGIDLTPFATMTSGAVKVSRYVGSQTISGVTLDGIVIADLEAGQTLLLRNTTINGTLVVRLLLGGIVSTGLGLLGIGSVPPSIRLAGASSIGGGTAWTGNLAILAADCMLDAPASTGSTVRGVAILKTLDTAKSVDFVGQLVLLENVTSTTGLCTVTRPAAFVPDTPLGVTWPGTKAVRIDWRGRQ